MVLVQVVFNTTDEKVMFLALFFDHKRAVEYNIF